MERILEPEVMDHPEDAEEYDAMDFVATDTAFAEAAVRLAGATGSPRIVDLGTGTGAIPLLLLDRHPTATVVGVDLAGSMLDVARKKAAARGHAARLELVCADVKDTGLPAGSFDFVMSNSVLHHMADPLTLLREMARLVKPGGGLLLRDLFRPPSIEEARAIVERVSGGDSPRQKQLFFDSLCAALTVDEVRELAQGAGLQGVEIGTVTDRHLTVERSST